MSMEMEDTDSRDSQDMISLRDVRVRYGEVEILHGITFDVKRGETLVILGGSGSGKSTLLRALVGLEKPSSGEIWIKGKNIAAISEEEMEEIRKKIGMSFQGGALFGSMTVGENVALPLREHTKLEDSTIEIMLRLKCDIHSWMTAYVGVVSHPYFAVSSEGGVFQIDKVPVGTYTIQAWHERFGVLTQKVRVSAGATVTADFTYGGTESRGGRAGIRDLTVPAEHLATVSIR